MNERPVAVEWYGPQNGGFAVDADGEIKPLGDFDSLPGGVKDSRQVADEMMAGYLYKEQRALDARNEHLLEVVKNVGKAKQFAGGARHAENAVNKLPQFMKNPEMNAQKAERFYQTALEQGEKACASCLYLDDCPLLPIKLTKALEDRKVRQRYGTRLMNPKTASESCETLIKPGRLPNKPRKFKK